MGYVHRFISKLLIFQANIIFVDLGLPIFALQPAP